jgi:hypothetical protein
MRLSGMKLPPKLPFGLPRRLPVLSWLRLFWICGGLGESRN